MASTPTERIDDLDRPSIGDGTGAIAVTDPLERARIRHERIIALLALGASIIGIGVVATRILTVEAWGGWRILWIAAFSGIVFAARLWWWDPLVWWKPWTRTAYEVTSSSAVILVDAFVGADFLVLSSSTGYLHVLAVTVSALRLRPSLCLFAAVFAAAQQAAVYLWSLPQLQDRTVPMARHYQELTFRCAVILLVGGVGVMLARTLRREIAAAANEERVRNAFGSYVDMRVVRRVLRGVLRVEPERRIITVMFVDIRGFTAISEKSTDPMQLFTRLNTALDAFATEVQAQGGIVNKFLGDGLLALFGAPESQADHARRAVRAALRIVDRAAALSADGRFPGLKVGVGIHSGEAVVGDLGGSRREFTAIGDVVNVAARVEALNKEHRTSILITEEARALVGGGAELRPLAPTELRGREGKVTLYSVLGLEGTSPGREIVTPVGAP